MELKYMSYSALRLYEECPRSFYLGKVRRAEAKQTWFFPVGTAVHEMIEDHIGGQTGKAAEDYFYPLVEAQMEIDPVDVNWLASGSQYDPIIRGKALEQVKACFGRAVEFLEDVDVWHVELDATRPLPGCEVPIKAYIDIVGEHRKHGPVVVDWKTGKSKPKNNLQIETYVTLWNLSNSDRIIDVGMWGMLHPDASKAKPVKGLSEVDASALGARYQAAYEKVKKQLWQANAGFHCRFCIQAPNCLVESPGSRRAQYYDRSEEDGIPF